MSEDFDPENVKFDGVGFTGPGAKKEMFESFISEPDLSKKLKTFDKLSFLAEYLAIDEDSDSVETILLKRMINAWVQVHFRTDNIVQLRALVHLIVEHENLKNA